MAKKITKTSAGTVLRHIKDLVKKASCSKHPKEDEMPISN
jgi:hypothetical protein